jgi:hypothetical protein
MGDALPALELGAGVTTVALAQGEYHRCATIATHALKCWGINSNGQLGLGDTDTRGDVVGEMGDALPAVDVGGAVAFVALPEDDGAPWAADDTAVDDGEGGCQVSRGGSGAVLVLALAVAIRRRRSERA